LRSFSGLTYPCGLATDSEGDLFVASSEGGNVLEFAPGSNSSSPSHAIAGPTSIQDATGLARDASGLLYVADVNANQVLIFAGSGGTSDATESFLAGDQTKIGSPSDIAVDRDGRILVATNSNGVLIFPPGSSGNVAPAGTLSVDPAYAYGYNVAIAP
jgi:sugar lactone lactonase YvrE